MFYITESEKRLEICGWSSRRDSMHMRESVKSNAGDIIRKDFFQER